METMPNPSSRSPQTDSQGYMSSTLSSQQMDTLVVLAARTMVSNMACPPAYIHFRKALPTSSPRVGNPFSCIHSNVSPFPS